MLSAVRIEVANQFEAPLPANEMAEVDGLAEIGDAHDERAMPTIPRVQYDLAVVLARLQGSQRNRRDFFRHFAHARPHLVALLVAV